MKEQCMRMFKVIAPGNSNQWIPISRRIGVAGAILGNAAFQMTNVAESAGDFFTRNFPIQAPYFPTESVLLPWHDEYWSSTDGMTFTSSSIAEEADRIAALD
jgi:hypothetical protein